MSFIDPLELETANELLARCRRQGIRVVLYRGILYGGTPDPQRPGAPPDWLAPPSHTMTALRRLAGALRVILGDDRRPKRWAIEQVDGGCLLFWFPPKPSPEAPAHPAPRRVSDGHDAA